MLPAWCAQWSPLAMIWGWQGDLRPVVGKPRAFWPGSQGRAFGAVHIGPAEGSRLEESAWAVCMQDFPLAGLPRLVCFLVGGSQRYRQDRILADSMGWMCRRWTRRRSKAMLPEPTRCGSPMRREPACLSMPLIDRGMLQIMIVLFLAASTMALARARSLRFDLCVLGVSLVPAMALIVLHGVFFEVQARYAFPVWVLPLFS